MFYLSNATANFYQNLPNLLLPASPFDLFVTQMNTNQTGFSPILPSDNYLKVFIVNEIAGSVAGVGYFPGMTNGCVVVEGQVIGNANDLSCQCNNNNLPQGADEGEILVHEIGHFLGLYHTFQGSCAVGNDDFVPDTPKQPGPDFGCPASPQLCFVNGPNNKENYMNYTDDQCKNLFTQGQEERMEGTLALQRQVLVSQDNLQAVDIQCNTSVGYAGFTASNFNVCPNESITFSGISTTGANVVNWNFGDGSPNETGSSVAHTYTTPGSFSVSYTIDNGSNTLCSNGLVVVANCPDVNCEKADWYFGKHCDLHFASGQSPQPSYTAINTIDAEEGTGVQNSGCATLFYTDGIKVWDGSHNLINPTNPLPGEPSTAQLSICPNPASANEYFVFTLKDYLLQNVTNFVANNFFKTTINTSGGISVGTTTSIAAPTFNNNISAYNEGIVIVPNCANNGYFIITAVTSISNSGSGGTIYAIVHQIDIAGAISLVASFPLMDVVDDPVKNFVTTIKVSPDSRHVLFIGSASSATTGSTHAIIMNFDNNTGSLTQMNPIFDKEFLSRGSYGGSFSPNSALVYIHCSENNSLYNLYQYDLNGNTPHLLCNMPALENTGMQLGPDGKIYISFQGKHKLAVINYPDIPGTGCFFNLNGPNVLEPLVNQNILTRGGLPCFSDALTNGEAQASFNYQITNCNTVHFNALNCNANSYLWNFGDGNTSSSPSPIHVYSANNNYTVTLTINGNVTSTQVIPIGQTVLSLTGSNASCAPLPATGYYYYSITGSDESCGEAQVTVTPTGVANISTLIPGEIRLDFLQYGNCVLNVEFTDCNGCLIQKSINISVTEGCCVEEGPNWFNITGDMGVSQFLSMLPHNGNVVYNQQITYSGKLTVDAPLGLVGVEMQMGAKSEIVVNSSSVLGMQGTKITACDKMWKGIQVMDNGRFYSAVSGNTRCQISDAQYAVQLGNKCTAVIKGTDFSNNYIGIYVPPLTGNTKTINCIITDNTFKNTTNLKLYFSGQSSLLGTGMPNLPTTSNHKGWAGIFVAKTTVLNVGIDNVFESLYTGIVSYNTRLNVIGCKFKDINEVTNSGYSSAYMGRGINHKSTTGNYKLIVSGLFTPISATPTFDHVDRCIFSEASNIDVQKCMMYNGCKKGIYDNGTVNTSTVIKNNSIACTEQGIFVSFHPSINKLQISNNSIEIDNPGNFTSNIYTGIRLENCKYLGSGISVSTYIRDNTDITLNNASHGIFLRDCKGILIKNNTVNCNESAVNQHGISIDQCQGVLVWHNTVQGLQSLSNIFNSNLPAGLYTTQSPNNGIFCNDVHTLRSGIMFQGASLMTNSFYANTMDNHVDGLNLITAPIIGAQTHQKNKWWALYSSYAASSTDPFSQINSPFFVNTSAFSEYKPVSVSSSAGLNWFVTDNTDPTKATEDECATLDHIALEAAMNSPIGEVEHRIARGDSMSDLFVQQTIYETQRQLYARLRADTSLLTDTIMQNFYDTAGTGLIGLFDSLNRQAEALYEIPDSIKLLLDSLNTDAEEWNATLLLYDSLMVTDSSMSFAYAMLSDSLQQLIAQHQETADSIGQLINEIRYARADSLQLFCNSISTTNSWQANEQECLSVELHTLAKDSFHFRRSTEEDLLCLSYKCPVKSGRGIIKARAIYALVDDTLNYYDDCTEADSTRRAMIKPEKQKQAPVFNLYPNPTNNNAVLAFENVTAGSLSVNLYNPQGVLLLTEKIAPNSTSYTIHTNNFNSGVIMVRLINGIETIYTNRLIVVK